MARTRHDKPSRTRISEDVRLALLTHVFPLDSVEAILDQSGVASVRECKLPASFMVYFIIALCLYMHKSMKETQRTVLDQVPSIGGRPRQDLIASRSAFTQARQRLGDDVLPAVFAQCVKPLATPETPGAFFHGRRLVIIDGSTLAFTDLADLVDEFSGPGKTKGQVRYPMGTLVVLVECGTHVIFGAHLGPYTTNETVLARTLLQTSAPRDALFIGPRVCRLSLAQGGQSHQGGFPDSRAEQYETAGPEAAERRLVPQPDSPVEGRPESRGPPDSCPGDRVYAHGQG